jgi:hypothetical protein
MKTIFALGFGLVVISESAHASCIWDTVAPAAMNLAEKAFGGGSIEVGVANDVYADGGIQTTQVFAEKKGIDGEWVGSTFYTVTVKPLDANNSIHAYSQKCEILKIE